MPVSSPAPEPIDDIEDTYDDVKLDIPLEALDTETDWDVASELVDDKPDDELNDAEHAARVVSWDEFQAQREKRIAERIARQRQRLKVLSAVRDNRPDIIAKVMGLTNTMDLRRAAKPANGNTPYPGIISSGDFVRGFRAPDYHVDGVAQAGFLYAVTAGTGTGKTAVLLLLAASTALGTTLCGRDVRKGRVVYFAGENPDDVKMRWIAMAHHVGFDPELVDVHFIAGTFSIPEALARIRADVERLGGADMVVVDTSAAFFQGEDENGNTALGKHARDLRALTTLPGHPAVFVACHPTKTADIVNLQPRGGGAFIAEVDGNLVLTKDRGMAKLHWQIKHRGADFEPLFFALETVTAPVLVDTKGRQVPTVMAVGMADWKPAPGAGAKVSEHDAEVLASLRSATRWGGLVNLANWRNLYYDEHKGEDRNTLKSRFRRGRESLEKAGSIKLDGDYYSVVEPGTPGTCTPEVPAYPDEMGDSAGGTHGTFPLESTDVPRRVPENEEEPDDDDGGEIPGSDADAQAQVHAEPVVTDDDLTDDQIPAFLKKSRSAASTPAEDARS